MTGMWKHKAFLLLLWMGCVCAVPMTVVAQEKPAPTTSLILSGDGAYVLDARNKLAWLRCAEGMRWTGQTCTGAAKLMSYIEARNLAAARSKTDGMAWRLPRMNELRRIADNKASLALFVGDPLNWTWSGTTQVRTVETNPYNYSNIASGSSNKDENVNTPLGWAVNMGDGQARGDVARQTLMVVRLVRPYQP
jgi:hypothetical protein